MARLVSFEQVNSLSQSWHDVVALKHVEVAIIAGLGQHTFDDHVIGDGCPQLGGWRAIRYQGIHRLRQLFIKKLAIAGRMESLQVAWLLHNLIEEASKEFSVFGLLPQESGQ